MSSLRFVVLGMTLALVSCAPTEAAPVTIENAGVADDTLQLHFVTGTVLGSYTRRGVTITFEARRGAARTPEDLAHDPTALPFGVSARFVDGTGRTFLVQHDDDEGAGWSLEEASDPALRTAAIAAALDAAKAIRLAQFPETHKVEQQSLSDLASAVGRVSPSKSLSPPRSPSQNYFTIPAGDRLYLTCPGDNAIEYYVAKKDAFFNGFPGEHTAVIYAGYGPSIMQPGIDPNGIPYPCTYPLSGIEVSCNHGTCASSPDMVYSCGNAGAGLASPARPFPTSGAAGGACPGGCTLSNACYGPVLGYHVCNDDSRIQINSLINNTNVTPTGWCTPYVPHFFGPGCYGEAEVIPPSQVSGNQVICATINMYNAARLFAANTHFVWY